MVAGLMETIVAHSPRQRLPSDALRTAETQKCSNHILSAINPSAIEALLSVDLNRDRMSLVYIGQTASFVKQPSMRESLTMTEAAGSPSWRERRIRTRRRSRTTSVHLDFRRHFPSPSVLSSHRQTRLAPRIPVGLCWGSPLAHSRSYGSFARLQRCYSLPPSSCFSVR